MTNKRQYIDLYIAYIHAYIIHFTSIATMKVKFIIFVYLYANNNKKFILLYKNANENITSNKSVCTIYNIGNFCIPLTYVGNVATSLILSFCKIDH